jgi:hypothetical protein
MSATRNKNWIGNYCLEQRQYKGQERYALYENSSHGYAFDTRLPGNGFNPGQIPGNQLSSNSVQVESFLFGINSTNLVDPAPTKIHLESKCLKTANCFDSQEVLMPETFKPLPGQRPFYRP